MHNKKDAFSVLVETILIITGMILLWYKILLPTSYYVIVVLLATLIVAQMLTRNDLLVLQIGLLLLFMNSVYYVATNYKIIPFWDGNWDFAVVKTFIGEDRISLISGVSPPVSTLAGYRPATILSIYSGWPLLHSLAFSLSQVSGIDVFQLSLILPPLISIVSFLFVYLIVEKTRTSLGLNVMVTNFALLIYATSAEALFWQIQFIHQNLGIMLLYITIYMFHLSRTKITYSKRCLMLTMFFAMSLVIAHHFTSFIMASFFFLFFAIQIAQKYLGRIKVAREKFPTIRAPAIATLSLALLVSTFMFLWWGHFATTYIWRQMGSTLTRFLEVLIGVRKFEYMPKSAYYPEILTPSWAISLLTMRDILIYTPAIFGLLIIMFRKRDFFNGSNRTFVVFSSIAFGLIIIINNFTIRVEIFRLFMMMLPLVALLSATFFIYFEGKARRIWRVWTVGTISALLIFASFVGLWGHRFAPMHLYDPSIGSSDIGERNIDVVRVSGFLNQRIQVTHFHAIWVDDDASLVSLLQPIDYCKIMRLGSDYIETHSSKKLLINELVCEFSNFNLYHYYAGVSSSMTPEEGQSLKHELYHYFENDLLRIYDDGKYRFWVYEGTGR
jgi:hypothetical protein